MIYKRGKCMLDSEGKCKKCGKRGACGVYWYKFMWMGRLVRESTKQGNDKVARQMESAHRTSLAKGEVGIRERKPVPTLAAFLKDRVLPWAEASFAASLPKNAKWYKNECRAMTAYKPLANAMLDTITGELTSDFAAYRLHEGKQVATVNSSIRVLRRALNLAVEWGVIGVAPKLKVLSGERRRERVVSLEEEAKYLAVASEPLASIAGVLADTGMRPEESFGMRWEYVTWLNGRNGALLVTHGKTASARRALPMTPRVRAILETRWIAAGKPEEGWVWPARTRSGHVEPNSIYGQHLKALEASKVRPFVLYSLRHTFLTRLGESGCDSWTLARIAGHSSVVVSARYVHPSEDKVLEAISRLGGHKSGHNEIGQQTTSNTKLLASDVN
ncbi:MAG: tyrosine-type recombinase/integrase [Candidatus Acidiferrales bacterium]